MRARPVLAATCLTLAGAVAGPVAGPVAGAQLPAPAGAAPCTYDACALRRERVFFTERIVAGTRGTVATRPSFFGAFPIDSLVRGVPEAEANARVYRRERGLGQLLSVAGTVLTAVAVVDAVRRSDGDCTVVAVGPAAACSRGWKGRDTAFLIGGVAFTVTGGWRLQIADRALNRAMWWYNRALPR